MATNGKTDGAPVSLSLPIIDFGKFLRGSKEDKTACAREIMNAFEVYGFLYLKNVGIDPQKIAAVYRASADFFLLPKQDKLKLAWKTPEANRGYVAPGRE